MKFTLPSFWNPRTMGATSAFDLKVYSSSDDEIYTWNNTYSITVNALTSSAVTSGPSIQMSEPATPQSVRFTRGSTRNGDITDYNFTVVPTNYLVEGD